jgi:hypothetical protein
VKAWWLSPSPVTGTWAVHWTEPKPGDSAISKYEIVSVPGEPEVASTLASHEPPGGILETTFTGASETQWTMKVRARNAAGRGSWSAPVTLGGI